MKVNKAYLSGLLIGWLISFEYAHGAQPDMLTHGRQHFGQRLEESLPSKTVEPELSVLETAMQTANRTGAPLLVIAGRKTCHPCRAIKQQVKTDEPTRQLLRDCVKVYLDCDSAEYSNWIAVHPPVGNDLPQWFLVRADGLELINRTGGVSSEELKAALGSSLRRAGKLIDESESDRIEELVVRLKDLMKGQDAIAAAEAIVDARPTLQIASNNYGESSNRLRVSLQILQSQLMEQIDSARKLLSEFDGLDESVQIQQMNEMTTLISRLRCIPSLAAPLRSLELEVAELQSRVEKSVRR